MNMILIVSFLSYTAGCRFPLNLEILSFLFSTEEMFINPILSRARVSQVNAKVSPAPLLSTLFSVMTLFNH